MKVPLTFLSQGSRRDVVAEFDANATVGQLKGELAAFTRDRTPSGPPLYMGGRTLTSADRLVDVGLKAGACLGTAPAPSAGDEPAAALELAVVGGLSAGSSFPLTPGEITIGRTSACDVVLHDELVSRLHARLTVADDLGVVLEDLDSANGTTLNGQSLTAPVAVEQFDLIGIGATVLSLVPATDDKADLEATGDGRYRYNKPPRARVDVEESTIAMPEEPPPPSGLHLPLGTVLAPLVLGPLYFLFTRQVPGLMLLMLASPLIAGLNAFLDQRSGRRKYRKLRATYEEARATFGARVDEAVRRDQLSRRAAFPDPAAVRVIASRPTRRLWERRPEDPDHLVLRIGLRDQPARVRLAGGAGSTTPPVAAMVPVTVPLATAGVLGIAGPRAEALPVLRALLLQVAALHSPNDVSIVVLSDGNEADWEWAKWLPHTVPRTHEACDRLFGFSARQRGARLAELAGRIRDRGSRLTFGDQGSSPRTVLVLDGIRRLRGDEAVAHVLRDGPPAGIEAICLAEEEAALPAETEASVVFGRSAQDDIVVTVSYGSEVLADVLPEGVGDAHSEAVARALAPLFEVAGTTSGPTGLPAPPVDHLALLEMPEPSAEAVLRTWQRTRQGAARALIGVEASGAFSVDLVRDGPHALIAGTTGAGKSELLQSLVASLALASRPDAAVFLLVDFKGRSAFKDCESLPHTVGVLSNLDGRLVERALDAIQAELRWRETRFAEAGARDFDEYARGADSSNRIPRLIIVVDELKELADAYGESIPRLNQTARLGRGLGVHLVLATQKPASVAGLADLRANTDLRICLRVQDDGDSRDLVGVADAARIPRGAPGRGIARLSDGRIVSFQAGYLGGPFVAQPEIRVRTAVHGFDVASVGDPPRAAGQETVHADGHGKQASKLQALVSAICDASRQLALPPPRRPWLPPLPGILTIDDPRLQAPPGPAAFPIGLLDVPAQQRQDPLVLDFEGLGHVVVAGRTRSGRTTVLRTLAGVVAARSSPADVHLYGLEFRRRALQDLEQLPHCGGVAGADDPDRLQRMLDFLQVEIERRGRVMGPWGSLAEQRSRAGPAERLPYVLVLCDNYESFYEQLAYEDGGRQVERFDWLLREGPARGIHFVVTTDQRAALHRLASVIDAQLMLRPTEQDAKGVLGLPMRAAFSEMPPGRGFWVPGPYEAQIALLSGSPSGESQASAVMELGAKASVAAQGIPVERLPARVGSMPDSITAEEAEALRRRPRPVGKTVVTFAVGGLDVAPLDVDLTAAGCTFVVAGPRGSGRSTALFALVTSLLATQIGPPPRIVIVTPRRSPLRQLDGTSGVTVLADVEALSQELSRLTAAAGPTLLVVDDAELLLDSPASGHLDRLVRTASDEERLVVLGGTTVDLLRRFSGWTFEARQSRSGMLLQPASATDGELLDLRLPRSTGQASYPLGRGVLAVRGRSVAAQVVVPTGHGLGSALPT